MFSELHATTAVLFSERSRLRAVAQAQSSDAVYEYTNARGQTRHWLKGEHAYLAPNAVRAFLDRCNIKHDLVGEEELRVQLAAYRLVFLANAADLADETIQALERWVDQPGNFLVVSGKTNLPAGLLGLASIEPVQPSGYTAWRWTDDSPFTDPDEWEPFYVSSYAGYTAANVEASADATVLAELLEVTPHGRERDDADIVAIGAGIVATPRSLYIANQLFEYLGGVFQAHLNIEAVRIWHTPTHWADTLLSFLQTVLEQAGAGPFVEPRLRTFSTYDGVLQLRHDPDHNADDLLDFSILEYEAQNGVPASYYLMDPAFCPTRCTAGSMRLWRERLGQYPMMEIGLHNDSEMGDPPTWIIGDGFQKHMAASSAFLQAPLVSAGRHMGFLVYPETIDAMDYLYQESPDVLGLCTFSIYDVIEYGRRNPDVVIGGKQITYATYDHDRPEIPGGIPGFWFPYQTVIATTEEHRALRGWDVTHDTDCDFTRLDELFNGYVGRTAASGQLGNGVFTIQYETQAATDPKYNLTRGHLPFLRYAIAAADRGNFWLATKRSVYERLNGYRAVQYRISEDGRVHITNPTSLPISGLTIGSPTPISGAQVDGYQLIHVYDERVVTIPELPPGSELSFQLLPATAGAASTAPVITQPNVRTLEIVSATYHAADEAIEVRARVLRSHPLVIERLRPAGSYRILLSDSAGEVWMTRKADAAGRLVILLHGSTTDFSPATVGVWAERHDAPSPE